MNITGIKHDSKGEITAYKLDDGSVISKQEGISLTKQGKIEGMIIGTSKAGKEYLRSMPDGKESNNLDNLKEVQQEELKWKN